MEINEKREIKLLRELLSIPTAPYNEHKVLEYVKKFAKEHSIDIKEDRFGNLILHLSRGKARPLGVVAHCDHPGFEVIEMIGEDKVRAHFHGGVEAEYFKNEKAVFFPESGGKVAAEILELQEYEEVETKRWKKIVTLKTEKELVPHTLGMWMEPFMELDEFGVISGAGLDDIGGVALALSVCENILKDTRPANFYVLISRAEEAGFVGTLAHLENYEEYKFFPKEVPFLSLETSLEKPPEATQGKGIVVRTGDRLFSFDPELIFYLEETARKVTENDPMFKWQMRRMDGGTCETSAFILYGFRAAGLALPLENYHNRNYTNKKIAPERVHLKDYLTGVNLLTATVFSVGEGLKVWEEKRKQLIANADKGFRRMATGEWK